MFMFLLGGAIGAIAVLVYLHIHQAAAIAAAAKAASDVAAVIAKVETKA